MQLLIEGRMSGFLLLLVIGVLVVYYIYLARSKGYKPNMRKMPALEAIPEAVGRSVELGSPVIFSPGCAGLYEPATPQTLAALAVLGRVSDLVAELDTEIIVGIMKPELIPVCEEICYLSYVKAGKPESYDEEKTVRYLSNQTFGYASGILGLVGRRRPGAVIFVGSHYAESLMIAESAHRVGALQIAGTANTHQMPFIVAACDYALIGEEIYAAGAYLSENTTQLGSIAGQDLSKAIMIMIAVLGTILATMNINILSNILNM